MILGAIIGDIAGSRFEFDNTDDYNFEIFSKESSFTDDTICTLAIQDAINKAKKSGAEHPDYLSSVVEFCKRHPYPMGGYGGRFAQWIRSEKHEPYKSFGNGSAMRVSSVAWAFDNLSDVKLEAKRTAEISHNHPEGIKGAVAVAHAIFALRHSKNKDDLIPIGNTYYPSFLSEEIHPGVFNETCQGTVPDCFRILYNSDSFEDAIRKAVSWGGDSDTIGAIVGSMAEALWDIPAEMKRKAIDLLTIDLKKVVFETENLI